MLNGSYDYDEEFDESTKELLEEITRESEIFPARLTHTNHKRVGSQRRWSKTKEKTSSSVSGRHFSHYKAGAKPALIPHLYKLKTSVAAKNWIYLERWVCGLLLMLEKTLGCTLLAKLQVILLMEADFNHLNKEIFRKRTLDNVRKYGLVPEEIYSERGKVPDDGTLARVTFNDVVRQTRLSAGVASVDAANCYDSVAHAIASLP